MEGTRPTMDRVKESIFSMIQEDIRDSIVLDLFAGTGNLGFEALSNGASFVYFVDHNEKAIQTIKKNATNFKVEDKIKCLSLDYKKALSNFASENQKFDLIFLDPPYHMFILQDLLRKFIEDNLLEDDSVIVLEMEENSIGNQEIEGLKLWKTRNYGPKQVNIYRKF